MTKSLFNTPGHASQATMHRNPASPLFSDPMTGFLRNVGDDVRRDLAKNASHVDYSSRSEQQFDMDATNSLFQAKSQDIEPATTPTPTSRELFGRVLGDEDLEEDEQDLPPPPFETPLRMANKALEDTPSLLGMQVMRKDASVAKIPRRPPGQIIPFDSLPHSEQNAYSENLGILRLSTQLQTLKLAPEKSSSIVPWLVDTFCEEAVSEILEGELPGQIRQRQVSDILSHLMEEIITEILIEEKEFVQLTNEDIDQHDSIFRGHNRNAVLVSGYSVDMTRDLLRCLDRTSWLNDEVINFYYKLMEDRNKKQVQRFPHLFPKVYFCNTFFYEKLMQRGYNYDGVKRWTRKADIFTYDKIIFPIHLSVHWTLAVCDFRRNQLVYYDSMLSSEYQGQGILNNLERYIKDEYREKKGGEFPHILSKNVAHGIPQQENGHDCGIFACKFANFICQDLDFTFDQRHMSYFRKRLSVEILRKSIL